MKLDWDIVRSILLALEDSNTAETVVKFTQFPDYDSQQVGYHMELLAEEGLVILLGGRVIRSGDGQIHMAGVRRLTLEGHKLLDTLRSDTVWATVKTRFSEAGATMSLASVGKVAEKVTESLLGLGS